MTGIIYILLCLAIGVQSESILILQPFSPISHRLVIVPIAVELAKKGHNVTWIVGEIGHHQLPESINLISLPILREYFESIQDLGTALITEGYSVALFKNYFKVHANMCTDFFDLGLVQGWQQNNRTFDLVLVDSALNECLLPVAHIVAKNVVYLNTATMNPIVRDVFSVPMPPSFVPMQCNLYSDRMTFWQRTINLLTWILSRYINRVGHDAIHEFIVKPYFPNTKPLRETMSDIPLVLVNADSVINSPRPYIPSAVNIGGIHCRQANPLPEGSLKRFLDGSGEHGFILVSFGTILDNSGGTEQLMNALVKVFSRIKQRIVWKLDYPIANLSDNVMIVKWLPQQDLLGHPKARASINHGGLLSVQEAIYHGVPLISLEIIPTDTPAIIAYTEALGFNIAVRSDNMTVENLENAINKACYDKTVRHNIQKYSNIFRDHPMPLVDKAVFWIEYVMRYDGARHLRVPDIGLVEYFLLDITGGILIVLGIILFLFYWVSKRVFHFVFGLVNRFWDVSVKVKLQ